MNTDCICIGLHQTAPCIRLKLSTWNDGCFVAGRVCMLCQKAPPCAPRQQPIHRIACRCQDHKQLDEMLSELFEELDVDKVLGTDDMAPPLFPSMRK